MVLGEINNFCLFIQEAWFCWNQGCGVGVGRIFNLSSRSRRKFNNSDSRQTFCYQLRLFVPQTFVSATLGYLSSLTFRQQMVMTIQKGYSKLTCIPTLRGHSRSALSLGLITQRTLSECNRSGLVSLKFPFAHSGWHYSCSVTLVTQQWMRSSHGNLSVVT